MSIYQTALDDIAAMLVAAGATGMTGSGTTVMQLKPTPAPGGVPEDSHNTKAVIYAANSNTTYKGSTIVYYDRLNLAMLANLAPLDRTKYTQIADVGVSVYTMLDLIRDAIGIQFTTDDLVDTQTVAGANGTDVTLTAKSTSVGWYGTVTLSFSGLPNIINAFNGRALIGF